MAVSSMTAAPGVRAVIRTCIGCRQRSAATELLRVTADSASQPVSPVVIRPDPRRLAQGRGAWLHPDLACVTLAERRRAFGRALRVPGMVDPAPVREYIEKLTGSAPPASAPAGVDVGETRESETENYEHPMKRQP